MNIGGRCGKREAAKMHPWATTAAEGRFLAALNATDWLTVAGIAERTGARVKDVKSMARRLLRKKIVEMKRGEPEYRLAELASSAPMPSRRLTRNQRRLAADWLPLACSIAFRIKNAMPHYRHLDDDEVQSAAAMAAVLASKRFDASKKFKPSPYLSRCVNTALLLAVCTSRVVYVPAGARGAAVVVVPLDERCL